MHRGRGRHELQVLLCLKEARACRLAAKKVGEAHHADLF